MRLFFLAFLVMGGAALAGCGGPAKTSVPNLAQAMPVDPPGGSYLLTVNTYAGDALHKMLLLRMGSGGGILTTSFVDMHDFGKTSAFGRVTSQQVGSRIGQYGFRVIEARLASTLSMAPRAGEFMLTRETARLLADTYDASAVLVGSYSDQGGNIFVSARVVRLSDNTIMAAYEYALPRDGDVSRLLADGHSGMDGDGTWSRYASRTPAFAPGVPAEGYAPKAAASRSTAPKSAPAASAPSRAVTEKSGGASPAVPRHVDPVPRASAPVKKAVPAPTASAAPQPLSKDMPAPAGIPGGM